MIVTTPGYNDMVFINCPFDETYTPLLQAIVYTIYRCGFVPESALNEDDGTDFRLDKIIRCIERCRYGIHDISCIELNDQGLPRFNMPFELGIFFGAKKFGEGQHKNKNALILERTKYQYQKYISDLNGIDTKAHNNNANTAIRKVRDWLSTASRRKNLPGYQTIQAEYRIFIEKLPEIVRILGLDPDDIPFNEFCEIAVASVIEKNKQNPPE